jgi:hypothetical protein
MDIMLWFAGDTKKPLKQLKFIWGFKNIKMADPKFCKRVEFEMGGYSMTMIWYLLIAGMILLIYCAGKVANDRDLPRQDKSGACG